MREIETLILAALKAHLVRVYLTVDPRSLAAARVALALALLLDLLERVPGLTLWYTNQGLLPNHTTLWRPLSDWSLSFFYMASWPHEAALGFAVCGAAYLMLLLGYRTRLAQVASFICVLSLHTRVAFVQSGGDVVLSELCFWMALLPLGRCGSLDALTRRVQLHRTGLPSELVERERYAPEHRPVVSLGVLLVLLQFSFMYLFNALHKTGVTWREGSVVHYILHQDRIVTELGLWVRGWLTAPLSQAMTWSALAVEWTLPLLLLSPVASRYTRLAAITLVVILHASFAAFMNLGIFGVAMIAYAPFFIPTESWNWLARRALTRRRERIVVYDAHSATCFGVARVLARLDTRGALRLRPSTDPSIASDAPQDLPAASVVVIDPKSGRRWTRSPAVAEVLAALPGGGAIAWCLRIPVISNLANIAYDAFAQRHSKTSAGSSDALHAWGTIAPESPPSKRWPFARTAMREALLALVLLGFASQIATQNRALQPALFHNQPKVLRMAASYLQLWQGWTMFAPEASRSDFNVSVDAITRDGRHVDPYNELASPRARHPGFVVAPGLGQDSFFGVYTSRIAVSPAYQPAFTEWILRYPQRTGRPQDEIREFTAYFVEDDSPAPGARDPRHPRARPFLKYP